VTEELEPAAHFTDFVQRDTCSFVEALCAIPLLYDSEPLREAMTNVDDPLIKHFICDAGFLFAFYSPVFDIDDYLNKNDANTAENLLATLRATYKRMEKYLATLKLPGVAAISPTSLLMEISGPTESPEKMRENLFAYREEVFSLYEEKIDAKAYMKRVTDPADKFLGARFPQACAVLTSLHRCSATEAACERAFSSGKRVISAQRVLVSEENAAILMEILWLNKQKVGAVPDDIVLIENDDVVPFVDRDDGAALTTEVAVDYVEYAVDCYVDICNAAGNEKCLHCKTQWPAHHLGHPEKVLQCTREGCARRWCYKFECVNSTNPLRSGLPNNNGQWWCTQCKQALINK
jgi:hypothetical protein